jgi:hypothetical protein
MSKARSLPMLHLNKLVSALNFFFVTDVLANKLECLVFVLLSRSLPMLQLNNLVSALKSFLCHRRSSIKARVFVPEFVSGWSNVCERG